MRLLKFLCGFALITLPLNITHAFLLITPAHTHHQMLWEKALVVFDPLNEEQTVITQIAISGSPKSFAILVPIRKDTQINYTTTSIWHALDRQVSQSKHYQREIKIYPYSILFDALLPHIGQQSSTQLKRNILKSKSTLIHEHELDLHQWLVSKGLLLNLESALSVKKVYQSGKVMACLWVTPPSNPSSQIYQTLSSTWIITLPTHEPFYEMLFPSVLHDDQDQPLSTQVELTLINEWKADLQWNLSTQSNLHKFYKSIDRFHVKQLNQKLRSTRWGFNRSGMLSQFKMNAHSGYQTLYFKPKRQYDSKNKKSSIKIKKHDFYIPIELALLAIWFIWWVWFRYAQRVSP